MTRRFVCRISDHVGKDVIVVIEQEFSCSPSFSIHLRLPVTFPSNRSSGELIYIIQACIIMDFADTSQTPTPNHSTDTVNMANNSIPNRDYTEAFNELNRYYANDELDT